MCSISGTWKEPKGRAEFSVMLLKMPRDVTKIPRDVTLDKILLDVT